MPKYKVCLNHNLRAHRYQIVRADNASQAIDEALKAGNWDPLNTDSQDLAPADAEEPTFWVDPCDDDGQLLPANGEIILDEYPHPSGYPYRADLLDLTQTIARMRYYQPSSTDQWEDAMKTVNDLIRMARQTINSPLEDAPE